MAHRFKTHLRWHDSRGSECEAEVFVTYARVRGYAGGMTSPPEPDDVDIEDITVVGDPGADVPSSFYDDDLLKLECFQDWTNDEEEAAEWREQSRRDRLMEGF